MSNATIQPEPIGLIVCDDDGVAVVIAGVVCCVDFLNNFLLVVVSLIKTNPF